jgi:mevalonate kinase
VKIMNEASVERSACAKVILCGEHAVVYGRPAIALPLPALRVHARMTATSRPFIIRALDVDETVVAGDLSGETLNPLARIAQLTLGHLKQAPPTAELTITSAIPVGANLGSGAAVSVAVARVIAAFFGVELSAGEASTLAYEVEKIHHGTPSGIDNTVVAFEQPVWFVKGTEPRVLKMQGALPLVIGDTGFSMPTRYPVADVRAAWEKDPERLDGMFNAIASLVYISRDALLNGEWPALGQAMNDNHDLLQQLDVSCAELDALCDVAREAGALGAKMSGGGRGGNMIALARDAAHADELRVALLQAGAKRVL